MNESQHIEWKPSWRDEYLKWICGFTNASFRVAHIESWGRGIDLIRGACRAYGSPAPDFRWDSGLWVEFPFAIQADQKTPVDTGEKTREKILQLVAENPAISMAEMATSLGITRKGVEWQVRKLREDGVLSRVGPAKGGHWENLK